MELSAHDTAFLSREILSRYTSQRELSEEHTSDCKTLTKVVPEVYSGRRQWECVHFFISRACVTWASRALVVLRSTTTLVRPASTVMIMQSSIFYVPETGECPFERYPLQGKRGSTSRS